MNPLTASALDTPIGRLIVLAGDEGVRSVRLVRASLDDELDRAAREFGAPVELRDGGAAGRMRDELLRYFAPEGARRGGFSTPLAPRGGSFQLRVWDELRRLHAGETASYGQIAERVGRPGAARAVGAACGANPVLIVIPCHRVVNASGGLQGFALGLNVKRALLEHERGWTDAASGQALLRFAEQR